MSQKKNIASQIDRYAANNLNCARMILADQGRYGGDQSLMVQWAKLVMSRAAITK